MVKFNKARSQESFAPFKTATEQILSAALDNQIYINEIECLTEQGRRNLLL